MKISNDGQKITKRFFEAMDALKESGHIRGIQTFTTTYDINRWNLYTVKNNPERSVLKPEWIYLLVKDFGVSADWIITGRGEMFRK